MLASVWAAMRASGGISGMAVSGWGVEFDARSPAGFTSGCFVSSWLACAWTAALVAGSLASLHSPRPVATRQAPIAATMPKILRTGITRKFFILWLSHGIAIYSPCEQHSKPALELRHRADSRLGGPEAGGAGTQHFNPRH